MWHISWSKSRRYDAPGCLIFNRLKIKRVGYLFRSIDRSIKISISLPPSLSLPFLPLPFYLRLITSISPQTFSSHLSHHTSAMGLQFHVNKTLIWSSRFNAHRYHPLRRWIVKWEFSSRSGLEATFCRDAPISCHVSMQPDNRLFIYFSFKPWQNAKIKTDLHIWLKCQGDYGMCNFANAHNKPAGVSQCAHLCLFPQSISHNQCNDSCD